MLLHLTWRSAAFPALGCVLFRGGVGVDLHLLPSWRRVASVASEGPPSKERRRAGTSGRVGATGFAKVHLEPRPEWLLSLPELPLNALHAWKRASRQPAPTPAPPHRRVRARAFSLLTWGSRPGEQRAPSTCLQHLISIYSEQLGRFLFTLFNAAAAVFHERKLRLANLIAPMLEWLWSSVLSGRTKLVQVFLSSFPFFFLPRSFRF